MIQPQGCVWDIMAPHTLSDRINSFVPIFMLSGALCAQIFGVAGLTSLRTENEMTIRGIKGTVDLQLFATMSLSHVRTRQSGIIPGLREIDREWASGTQSVDAVLDGSLSDAMVEVTRVSLQ